MRSLTGPWLFLIFGLLACSKQNAKEQGTNEAAKTFLVPDTKPLNDFFSSRFKSDEPGGAVLILSGDSVIFSKGYGVADIQTKESITPHTLFNIGSVSKTFVSNAILMLQQQGELSVNDNLLKYFPDFQNKELAKKVQLKHLLTHTSGLPDIRYPWKDSLFYLTAKDKENWAPIMKATRFNFEPGSSYEYSNPAFNALALIVEQVSGMPWQQYVQDNIMKPAGMNTSTITNGPHPKSGVSHGYIRGAEKWLEKDYGEEPTFAAAGNGGIWSSVEELAKYEVAIRDKVFLDAATLTDSHTIKTFSNWSSKNPPTRGWSWSIGQTKNGLKTVWHDGWQGGFRAYYLSVPKKEWLIVVLTNCPQPVEQYAMRGLEFLETGK